MAIHFTAEILNLSWGKLFFIIRPDKKILWKFRVQYVVGEHEKYFLKITKLRRVSAIWSAYLHQIPIEVTLLYINNLHVKASQKVKTDEILTARYL